MIMGILHYSSDNPLLASIQAKWVMSPVLPTDSFCSQSPHQCGFSSWFLSIILELSHWRRIQCCSIPISAETVCNHTLRFFGQRNFVGRKYRMSSFGRQHVCALRKMEMCRRNKGCPGFAHLKVHCRKQWGTEPPAAVQPSRYSVADRVLPVAPLGTINSTK